MSSSSSSLSFSLSPPPLSLRLHKYKIDTLILWYRTFSEHLLCYGAIYFHILYLYNRKTMESNIISVKRPFFKWRKRMENWPMATATHQCRCSPDSRWVVSSLKVPNKQQKNRVYALLVFVFCFFSLWPGAKHHYATNNTACRCELDAFASRQDTSALWYWSNKTVKRKYDSIPLGCQIMHRLNPMLVVQYGN